ncbi:hypothetical protein [Candidatus Thiodiazotropha sp. CDECU1]|uniref:hypothetical protein n=1 Tax=Candidatus Thiodiazotropha sp. CDECU1 TaxID=3065865 RepID=UPI00292D8C1A|nr:hypothetical protein [Candidatus Thiodiazotropha sp. CDECU1]
MANDLMYIKPNIMMTSQKTTFSQKPLALFESVVIDESSGLVSFFSSETIVTFDGAGLLPADALGLGAVALAAATAVGVADLALCLGAVFLASTFFLATVFFFVVAFFLATFFLALFFLATFFLTVTVSGTGSFSAFSSVLLVSSAMLIPLRHANYIHHILT